MRWLVSYGEEERGIVGGEVKVEMVKAIRGGRRSEHPVFLTCLIALVMTVLLLHSMWTSTGPLRFHSLVTRPAFILSRLDVAQAPAKERPQTLLTADGDRAADGERSLKAREMSVGANDTLQENDSGDRHRNSSESRAFQLASLMKLEKPSHARRVYEELRACKQAINEATEESADPSLHRVLYKNVTEFSKSYELMEAVFKIYTYRDGRKPLVHSGPLTGIYASEGQFIERMKSATQHLTDDPGEAHMFFLPYSVQQMVTHLYVPNSHSMLPIATFIKEYVETVAMRYPFWNRTQGADHFFVSCHDWGPLTTRDHPALRQNAVKVVCNADLSDGLFKPERDASLPEVYIHNLPSQLGGPRHDERPYLAFFAGQMHGRVRPVLLHHWKDKDPEMKIYEVLPKAIARSVSYIEHMRRSKFCICAMGYEVNSPRIVEAIYYDCVPVIIADGFVLPFSDVLNWDAFSVTVPESEIPNLKRILRGISDKKYMSKQRRLRHVRRHFVWHEDPEKYDVFNMILHSVWASRLHRLEQIHREGEL